MNKIYLFFFLISLNFSVAQDGTIDASFNVGTGFNGSVFSVKYTNTNNLPRVCVGGDFSTYKGGAINTFVKLFQNGNLSQNFGITGPTVAIEECSLPFSTSYPSLLTLIGGGYISGLGSYKGFQMNTTYEETTISTNIGSGFNGRVLTIKEQSDGKILLGGWFTQFKGNSYNRIIRLNIDGTIDTSFNVGTGFDNSVHTIKQQADGKILIGGTFRNYKGLTANGIIRLNIDGSVDSSFNIGTGFNDIAHNDVYSIVILADGKILVGGDFIQFNNQTANKIICLNQDGTKNISFNYNNNLLYGDVYTLVVQNDGKIIAGGTFTPQNTAMYGYKIIRLNSNGTYDNTFVTGTGFNNAIWSIDIQPDGKILIGGGFTSYNGTSVNRLIRLNNPSVLSNSDFYKSKISLYPNPVNEILNLDLSNIETIENLTIYDVTGKNVLEIKDISNHQIDVSSLEKGVYFIDIKTQNGSFKEKFVKN